MAKSRTKTTEALEEADFGESLFLSAGFDQLPLLTAGVDEAGRGPLAGPVCAAAVILDPEKPIEGLNDSKKLSAKKREALAPLIRERALAWGVGWTSVEEIDSVNILEATFLAMERALAALSRKPELILIDGNRAPKHLTVPFETIVKGDAKVPAISAASILAKTERDHLMAQIGREHPEYGFGQHAGYGTRAHIEAIEKYGVLPCHRRSFEPVKSIIAKSAKTK